MIISHRHKFIFVKPYKVAGTSLHHMLAEHCGPNDIISKTVDEDGNMIHPGQFPGPIGRGFKNSYHIAAHAIREQFPREWAAYTKITIVRNPWDLVLSMYLYAHREWQGDEQVPSFFNEFVLWHVNGFMTNEILWHALGTPYADITLRFEHFDEDCEKLFAQLGLPYTKPIHANKNNRKPNLPYALMYTPFGQMEVGRHFSRVINQFGYQFEHPFIKDDTPRRFFYEEWLKQQKSKGKK